MMDNEFMDYTEEKEYDAEYNLPDEEDQYEECCEEGNQYEECEDDKVEYDTQEKDKVIYKSIKEEFAKNNSNDIEDDVILYQSNKSQDIFNKIYNIYYPKFNRLALRMNNEDIVQELGIALLRAVSTFKIGMNAKFNTYFWNVARNHIGVLKIRKNARKRNAENGIVSMHNKINVEGADIEIGDMIEDPKAEKSFENISLNTFLQTSIFPHMQDIDINILKYYINGYTLEEIGKKIGGLTAPAVHVKLKSLKSKNILYKAFFKYFKEQGYLANKQLA